jgi:hypothetical protein
LTARDHAVTRFASAAQIAAFANFTTSSGAAFPKHATGDVGCRRPIRLIEHRVADQADVVRMCFAGSYVVVFNLAAARSAYSKVAALAGFAAGDAAWGDGPT